MKIKPYVAICLYVLSTILGIGANQFASDQEVIDFCNPSITTPIVRNYKTLCEEMMSSKAQLYRKASLVSKNVSVISLSSAWGVLLSGITFDVITDYEIPVFMFSVISATSIVIDGIWFQRSEQYYTQAPQRLENLIAKLADSIVSSSHDLTDTDKSKIAIAIPQILETKQQSLSSIAWWR